MLITTASNCCQASGVVYAGIFTTTTIYQIDFNSLTFSTFTTGVIVNCRGIAVDPTTGMVYVVGDSGGSTTVYGFDSSGTLVWTTALGAVGNGRGIAVNPQGFVYVCTTAGIIYKFQANDGTQITTGGWPFTSSLNRAGVGAQCICADQVGNIYVGGDSTARTSKAIALDGSATLLWTSNVSNVLPAAETNSKGVYGIAINAPNNQVHCLRATARATETTVRALYHLNSSTGAITGSAVTATSVNDGSLQLGNSSDYDSLNNSFSGTAPDSGTLKDVYENLAAFTVSGAAGNLLCLVTTPTDDIIVGTNTAADGVINISTGQKVVTPGATSALATSFGKIGAFGL
jgi:DNA-binding beta-propeller fold protein YncE